MCNHEPDKIFGISFRRSDKYSFLFILYSFIWLLFCCAITKWCLTASKVWIILTITSSSEVNLMRTSWGDISHILQWPFRRSGNLHSRLRMDHLVRSKHYTSQFITGLWTLKMFLNQSLKMNTRKWTNTWFQTILWKNRWMSVAWMTTVQTSSRIEAIFMGELLFLEFHKWAKSFLWNQFQLSQWKVFVLDQRKKNKTNDWQTIL